MIILTFYLPKTLSVNKNSKTFHQKIFENSSISSLMNKVAEVLHQRDQILILIFLL